ncbi:hypothetical protein ACP4OV_026426 [Aristida adscensionis]
MFRKQKIEMGHNTSIPSPPKREEADMEKISSDLEALKRLMGLLQNENLGETSRAIPMNMLDDATKKTSLNQAKNQIKMDRTELTSSSPNHEEGEMKQNLSYLQALRRQYEAIAGGNLDETSKARMMNLLDDATQQALQDQAKMVSGCPALGRKLSIRSDRRALDDEPRVSPKPPASPAPSAGLSLRPSEMSRRLKQQNSVSSRVHGRRQADGEPLLARLASSRSSRTAAPPPPPPQQHRPSQEQRLDRLGSYSSSVAAVPPRSNRSSIAAGTVAGSSRDAGRGDLPGSRGERSSLELSGRRPSLSPEPSQGTARRPRHDGRDASRRIGAEGGGGGGGGGPGASTRRFGRLDSGVSASTLSRRGSPRAGRGVASPRYSTSSSASSDGAVTIRSSIRPRQEPMDRHERRAEEEDEMRRSIRPRQEPMDRYGRRAVEEEAESKSTPPRRREHGAISSPGWSSKQRRMLERIDSGSVASPSSSSSHTAVTTHGRIRARRDLTGRRLRQEKEAERTPRRRRERGAVSSAGWSDKQRRMLERIDSGSVAASPDPSSSSSHTTATTRSRAIRARRDITGRRLRRDKEEERTPRRRRKERRTLKRVEDSGSSSGGGGSSFGAAVAYPPTSVPAWSESTGSDYSYPSPAPRGIRARPAYVPEVFAPRGISPPPAYVPDVFATLRSFRRRHKERQERHVGRLRLVKNKLAEVLHHYHHHHHHFPPGMEEGPSRRDLGTDHCIMPQGAPFRRDLGGDHRIVQQGAPSQRGLGADHGIIVSPWNYIGRVFHRKNGGEVMVTAGRRRRGGGQMPALFGDAVRHLWGRRGEVKTATSRMRRGGGQVPALFGEAVRHLWGRRGEMKTTSSRRRRGGGQMPALFGQAVQHLWGGRRRKAPAHAGLRRMGSRVQVKKLRWWQQVRRKRNKTGPRLGF